MKNFLVTEYHDSIPLMESFMIIKHDSIDSLEKFIFEKFKNYYIESYDEWFSNKNRELKIPHGGSQLFMYLHSESEIIGFLEIKEISSDNFNFVKENITKPNQLFGGSYILYNAGFL